MHQAHKIHLSNFLSGMDLVFGKKSRLLRGHYWMLNFPMTLWSVCHDFLKVSLHLLNYFSLISLHFKHRFNPNPILVHWIFPGRRRNIRLAFRARTELTQGGSYYPTRLRWRWYPNSPSPVYTYDTGQPDFVVDRVISDNLQGSHFIHHLGLPKSKQRWVWWHQMIWFITRKR